MSWRGAGVSAMTAMTAQADLITRNLDEVLTREDAIAHRGAQNHRPARAAIEAKFREAFGYSPFP